MRTVVLYERPGCHLCEQAAAHLERLRGELEFGLERRNIEEDDALHRRMLERIPVIELDGQTIGEFFVDERALRERLQSPSELQRRGQQPRDAGPRLC